MADKNGMVKAGMWPAMAEAVLFDSVATAISAAGTNQATATQLTSEVNTIGTAAASTGVILPTRGIGEVTVVCNKGANAVAVFPQGTDTINAGIASAAVSVPVGKAAWFVRDTATTWVAVVSA